MQHLTARLRRLQFLVGLGFASAVAGALISTSLADRVRPLLEGLGPGVMSLFVATLVSRLWVLVVLPLLCYGAARVLELRPWPTALGAGLTGEAFYLALDLLTVGVDGLAEQWASLLLRVLTLALGILLARRAVRWGRADAARADEKAKRIAEANRARYAEYLADSERVASQREAAQAAAGATSQLLPDAASPVGSEAPPPQKATGT